MLKLVLPTVLVLLPVYGSLLLVRALRQRGLPPRRSWALFVAGRPKGLAARWLARRVRAADPTARVAVYRLADHGRLATSLGVEQAPALVLGDGEGGAKVRLEGRDAVRGYLSRRRAGR